MRVLLLFVIPLFLVFSSVSAIEPMTCSEGYQPTNEHFSLARVTGNKGDKAFFFSDATGCPGKDSCRTKAYVLPGDEVLVSRTAEGWACVRSMDKKKITAGWVKASRIERLPEPKAPAPADWAGTWRLYENFLKVSQGSGQGALDVSGEAFWHGGLKGEVVHQGMVKGSATPQANRLVVQQDLGNGSSCVVEMTLLGRYLVVTDNQKCGGMNVMFTGVYAKAEK